MLSKKISLEPKIPKRINGPIRRDPNQDPELITNIVRALLEALRRDENWPIGLIVVPIRPVERVVQNRGRVDRIEPPRPDNNETEDRASHPD